MTAAAVILAGGLGAGLRFVLGTRIQRGLATELPWGTAIVNMVGALLLGMVAGTGAVGSGPEVASGFLAGFTTYSTWMIESVHLWVEGSGGRHRALSNLVGLIVAGLLAALAGYALGDLLG